MFRRCRLFRNDISLDGLLSRIETLEKAVVNLRHGVQNLRSSTLHQSQLGGKSGLTIAEACSNTITSNDNGQDVFLEENSTPLRSEPRGDEILEQFLTPEQYEDLHQFYAKLPETYIPLKNMLGVETLDDLRRNAEIVQREYAIRVAKRANGLTQAPCGFAHMPSIQKIRRWYEYSFRDIRVSESPHTKEKLIEVDETLRRVYIRHLATSDLLSDGLREFAQREGWNNSSFNDPTLYQRFESIDEFLNVFVQTRIRLRFLIQHQLQCTNQILGVRTMPKELDIDVSYYDHDPKDFIGAICKNVNMVNVCKHGIRYALAEAEAGDVIDPPEVQLKVCGDENFTFASVPSSLVHMVSALVAEGIRSNVINREKRGETITPVTVLLSQSPDNDDIVVRVTDTAGGIAHDLTPFATKYLMTAKNFFDNDFIMSLLLDGVHGKKNDRSGSGSTVDRDNFLQGQSLKERVEKNPMLGWMASAVRLPYAVTMAKVFEGELTVNCVDGFSTDRVLYLPVKGIDTIMI